ncbi:MAG: protein-glutamate O-methyltransferase CheR [Polyangiaceae bacterium]
MSISAGEAAFVCDLVYERSAIVLDQTKTYLLETRLLPLARSNGFESIDAFVVAARRDRGPLQTSIVEALATCETSFFRDLWPFECLQKSVLPALIESRVRQRKLVVWSAACSSGQEVYSIVMTILEHFPDLANWDLRFLATDLSEQILARARSGRYQQLEMNRGLPIRYLTRYFERQDMYWQVRPNVRERVEFKRLNLIDRWSLQDKPDIVFMRNVLIYFDEATKRRILQKVRQSIAPDGALFLGAAETPLNIDDGWERISQAKFSYFRVRQV